LLYYIKEKRNTAFLIFSIEDRLFLCKKGTQFRLFNFRIVCKGKNVVF
jgi:hypothetical protein